MSVFHPWAGLSDQAVVNLLKLQALDISAHADVDMAENTIESLGRLGLIKPSWCDLPGPCPDPGRTLLLDSESRNVCVCVCV